jgi:hypothetical protein
MKSKPEKKPQRNATNATVTFSLPKAMKEQIRQAAEADRRTVANWLVKELEPLVAKRGKQS